MNRPSTIPIPNRARTTNDGGEPDTPAASVVLPLPRLSLGYRIAKRCLDCVIAATLLVIASPVLLICMALVKLTSRGPVFYTQTRLGMGRRPFRIIKLRTMLHNCEATTGPCWSKPGDPRVTAVGNILRKLHLDELPQLWNVLKGDMSLVGPRPERPEFIPELERLIPNYGLRMEVRPGITGLAQVRLPADTSIESVKRKLRFDLYYLYNCSFLLEFRILLATALKVLRIPTSWTSACLMLPTEEFSLRALLERVQTHQSPVVRLREATSAAD